MAPPTTADMADWWVQLEKFWSDNWPLNRETQAKYDVMAAEYTIAVCQKEGVSLTSWQAEKMSMRDMDERLVRIMENVQHTYDLVRADKPRHREVQKYAENKESRHILKRQIKGIDKEISRNRKRMRDHERGF
jgi:hypothetical protein